MEKTQIKPRKITISAVIIGILVLILQHGFYYLGHLLALVTKIPPFLPKIPVIDDAIPLVSIFIIPYVWSYVHWALVPTVVSRCEKNHYLNYLFGNLLACVIGMLVLAFAPTYMDRVAEGLYEVTANPTFFDKLRQFWYDMDGSAIAYNLLPSFHCLNSTLCFLGVMGRKEIPIGFRIYAFIMAFATYAATVFVKQHYFLDIIFGILVAVIGYFISKRFRLGEKVFNPILNAIEKSKQKKLEKKNSENA